MHAVATFTAEKFHVVAGHHKRRIQEGAAFIAGKYPDCGAYW
jgi:hypothetical protein